MTSRTRLVERLALALLPARDRDVLAGDAEEECGSGPIVRLRYYLPLVTHYQAEGYRELEDRLAVFGFLLLALGVLWLVPAAAAGTAPSVEIFPDPFLRVIAAIWSTSHVTSALAAGLLVGRLPGLGEHGTPARWHVGAAAAAVCLVVWPSLTSGAVSGLLLLGGLWLGDRARTAVAPPTAASGG